MRWWYHRCGVGDRGGGGGGGGGGGEIVEIDSY